MFRQEQGEIAGLLLGDGGHRTVVERVEIDVVVSVALQTPPSLCHPAVFNVTVDPPTSTVPLAATKMPIEAEQSGTRPK